MNAQKANNINEKVRELQRKLYCAAKSNSKRKFHALYDKVYRIDVLEESWKKVKSNGGTGGIDKITVEYVENYGVEKLLSELQLELKEGRYQPNPVKRSYIPKKNGDKRPLGIPTIKDRIIQMAVKKVIEPIFEADFIKSSYGFRPKKSARQALEVIRLGLYKNMVVLDADIKSYFDCINHGKLIKLVELRISDRRIVKLIWKWLKAGAMEGNVYTQTEIGSPQGGVISPLLSNIYLHYMDYVWEKHYKHLGELIRYADDFVVLCKTSKDAGNALKVIKSIANKLELRLHGEKTKIVNLWDGKSGFDFLGMHHIREFYKSITGKQSVRIKQFPSSKSMVKIMQNIKSTFNGRKNLWMDIKQMIEILNPQIIGMRNYYNNSTSTAYKKLMKADYYLITRFTIWYNQKKQGIKRRNGMSEIRQIVYKCGLQKFAV